MSRFFTKRLANLTPYTPGEQPQDKKYVKLNTNESPFPPSPEVQAAVAEESGRLQLYSDPECADLRRQMAQTFGLQSDQIVMVNGSDEALNFAFMAFADEDAPLAFPDITYGFYPVFAELNHIPYEVIPLKDDFSVNVEDYIGIHKTVVLANPNALTGKFLPLSDLERILSSNPDNMVIIDEAYVNFGGESAVRLLPKYENLLVIGTFSKSHSLAGARLGYALASTAIAADLNTIRYSTNPYNVNRMTSRAGIAALQSQKYYLDHCRVIAENRTWTVEALEKLGFSVIPSLANFIFATSPAVSGETLYQKLKERGVLIRHFRQERICNYNRITIGTREQMAFLAEQVKEILEEAK